ncbi:DNA polymerase III subunit delta [Mycoplasmopsis glycophila]|uniref:DNA polymerase III subunit delta n=1 Tax=Mycoplasmopsis glycophila TaxID=171285 RepID=A0A449AUK9_9BACT|nr:DNA polymerase III subunit delta [Mycoplasmopsis glycophila]VEU70209.1 DNA-directed DNA polymerase [Mycoplasmopsis glycophila]
MTLIYGAELFLIENKIKKIKQQYKTEDIVSLKNKDLDLNEIINLISSKSILSSSRCIIMYNLDVLNQKKIKKEDEQLLSKFLKILQNEKEDQLIIVHENAKIQENTFTDELFKIPELQVIYTETIDSKILPNEIIKYIQNKGGQISYLDVLFLIEKLPDNLGLIIQEVNKLLLINKKINRASIEEAISDYAIVTNFSLINAIQSGDFHTIYKEYKNKINSGETIIQLVSQISWSLIFAHQIYSLKKLNMSNKEIASFLKVHEYRIKLALDQITKYGIKKIRKIIKNLADLDYKLKSSSLDEVELFEYFLINNFIFD